MQPNDPRKSPPSAAATSRPKARWKLPLLLVALLALCSDAPCAVKAERARISSGFSLRITRFGWGQFECLVENSDSVKHKVSLRIVALEGQQSNVFSETVSVLPKTRLRYSSPILLENSERYNLEVFVDGRKLPSSPDNEMLIKMISNRQLQIGVLNDSDASLGAFVQLERFKDKLFTTTFSSSSAPATWVAYKDLAAVVIQRPKYEAYSSRQWQALIDYVAQGGTLIFVDPEGALAAVNSPLASLLPASPCQVREIDSLPELSKLFPKFKGFSGKPVKFLETVPSGDEGIALLKAGQFDVFKWKRFGLGSVRLSAIPLDDETFKGDSESWGQALSLVFNQQRLLPDHEQLSITLDQMTGFKVPGISRVRGLLFAYLALFAAIVAAGKLSKRAGWAWMASAALALGMTWHILSSAASSAGGKGPLLALIRAETSTDGAATSESYCAYFSDVNGQMEAVAPSENALFCTIPPNLNSFLPFGMAGFQLQDDEDRKIGSGRKRMQRSPLQVAKPLDLRRDQAGKASIDSCSVSANTSRQFMMYGAPASAAFSASQPAPKAIVGADGLKLEPWKAPAGLNFEKAFLVMPNGSWPLEASGGTLSMPKGRSGLFQADPISKGIRLSLESGYMKQSPYIALMGADEKAGMSVGGNPRVQGRKVVAMPVDVSCQSQAVTVPPEAIVFQSGDSSSRMAMNGNRLKADFNSQGGASLSLLFSLPPALALVKPEEIVVGISYVQGGNINVAPVLILSQNAVQESKPAVAAASKEKGKGKGKKPAPQAPAQKPGQAVLKGVEREPGVFVFSGPSLAGALDPLTGTGMLSIESVERNPDLSETQKFRANNWSLTSVSISVKGKLPERLVPFTY